jgi:hypothetical protein
VFVELTSGIFFGMACASHMPPLAVTGVAADLHQDTDEHPLFSARSAPACPFDHAESVNRIRLH